MKSNRQLPLVFAATGLALAFAPLATAQMVLNTLNVAVVENFNGMGTGQTATLSAGFSGQGNDATSALAWSAASYTTTQARFGLGNTGTPSPVGFVNLGVNGTGGSASNRALGWYSNASSGDFYAQSSSPYWVMVRLQNGTSSTLTSLDVSFDLLQWTNNGSGVSWQILGRQSASGLAGSYANIGAGTLATIANAGNTNALNPLGSQSISFTLSNLTVAPGGDFYLAFGYRSSNTTVTGAPTLGIDNFSVTAIPEPSAFAAFAGLAALGLAVRRRGRA